MKDDRDPQFLGEAILNEMKYVGIGVCLAADRVEAGLSLMPVPRGNPAQAFVSNQFQFGTDRGTPPQEPPTESRTAP